MPKPNVFSQMPNLNLSELVLRNLGFWAFLGFLALVYIANAHLAERNVRRVQELHRELRELRWSYMSLQSENMFNSLRSEVVDKVRDEGLRLHRGAPRKILVTKNEE